MRPHSKQHTKYLVALFFALLIFAAGHSFFLPPSAFAFDETAPAHHDLAPYETEENHSVCPSDLHQLSYSRDQHNQQDLSDVPIADISNDYSSCRDWSFYTLQIFDRANPYIGIPFDQKIVLLI